MNPGIVQTAIEAAIAVVLKNGEINAALDACIGSRSGQVFIVLRQFVANGEAFFILA